ncbi:MAG: exo-alpha-sialidase [Cyclobacteriaceae bacterium]|nr:exo-alpha-sialidase [Cyclobacteriaceae bacterium]
MKRHYIIALLVLGFASCAPQKEQKTNQAVTSIASPAGDLSATPYLFTDTSNKTYLSWTEKTDSANLFKFSVLESGSWSKPKLITSGNTWFINWADYPMIAGQGNGNLIAHILNKSGESTYAYDVKMFSSTDNGEQWNHSFVLHDDGKQAEHGFVSLLPYGENIFVAWLDGRNTVMEGMENMAGHDGHHARLPDGQGAMSLRAAIIDYQGNKINEWELDNKTCDCCQTAAAITDNGPVVVYRDRSDEEIRDMSIVRWVDGEWTQPQTIYADNWKIAGCPVNGPRISANGNNLAVAWFGLVDNEAQVKVIFSNDGGASFGTPVRIDEGQPIGRVDIEMTDNGKAMVSWMEGTKIKAVKVSADGTKGEPIDIATSSEARSSGFPQMAKNGNDFIFAWTDDGDKKVKTASVKL